MTPGSTSAWIQIPRARHFHVGQVDAIGQIASGPAGGRRQPVECAGGNYLCQSVDHPALR